MKTANRIYLVLCVCVTMLAAGCASGPDYKRPEVSLPTGWQSSVADPAGEAPSAQWWTSFQSADLERLMDVALSGNRDLKAAASRVAQARALTRVARADTLPTVKASGGVARKKEIGDPSATKYNAGITAGYEIDAWGRNRQIEDATVARLDSSLFAQDTLKMALQTEVAVAYFRALSASDRLVIARDTLRNAESLLRVLEAQYRAGSISGLEISRQQSLVTGVQASIPPIAQEREQALNALALLTGQHRQQLPPLSGSLNAIRLPAIAAGLPSALLERRADIRQAEANLVAANADANAARAALFPALRLTAEGGTESAALSALLRSKSFVYNLAANVVAPIFDGGRLRAQADVAKERREELVHAYQQSILMALRDVENSLAAAKSLSEQATLQQQAIAHASKALRIANLRFRNGATDFSTVLDAQRVLLNVQSAREAVTLSRYLAAVDLYRALGGSQDAAATR